MIKIPMAANLRKVTILCSICGKRMTIKLFKDGKYKGGYYFGKINVKREEIEYWECDKCYKK